MQLNSNFQKRFLVGAFHFSQLEWLAPLALFTFGSYLALAGHRSHLYQSSNALVAYLAGQLRSTEPKSTETHP